MIDYVTEKIYIRINDYIKFANEHTHLFINDENPHSIKVILDKDEITEQQMNLYKKADELKQPRIWYDIGIISEDKYFICLRDLVRFPNGDYGAYFRLLHRTSMVDQNGTDVVILPIIKNKILLINHFRHEDRKWHLEIPRGFAESEFSAVKNAEKEFFEETGLESEKTLLIGGVTPKGGYQRVVYFAIFSKNSTVLIDNNEGIDKFELLSYKKFGDKIKNGQIDDPYTINAFSYATVNHLLK